MVKVAHERSARQSARNFPGWAAHINVDNLRAGRLDAARGLRKGLRLSPNQLNSVRRDAFALGPRHGFHVAFEKNLRRDHFGEGQSGAETARYATHGKIGHARHRR